MRRTTPFAAALAAAFATAPLTMAGADEARCVEEISALITERGGGGDAEAFCACMIDEIDANPAIGEEIDANGGLAGLEDAGSDALKTAVASCRA